MGNRIIRWWTALGVCLLGALGTGIGTAQASPSSVCCYVPPPYYEVINVSTYENFTDFTRRVALCYPGGGGTCSITRESSVSTTVQTSLSATAGTIASQLGFSLSRSSSTSVTCNSPRMTTGQYYAAYAVGTRKFYQIRKWQGDGIHPARVIGTSGTLAAWQPYSYPAIYCSVYP